MVLVSLCQNIADGNPFKTWLVLLAPPITIGLKFVFGMCSPVVLNYIRHFRVNRSKMNLVARINKMLEEPGSAEVKSFLEEKRTSIQLSIIDDKLAQIEAIKNADDNVR